MRPPATQSCLTTMPCLRRERVIRPSWAVLVLLPGVNEPAVRRPLQSPSTLTARNPVFGYRSLGCATTIGRCRRPDQTGITTATSGMGR